eukprot:354496_1
MTIEGCDSYNPNDRTAIYVLTVSYFLWWAIHEFLETYCNMGPIIRRTVSLQEMQEHIDSANERKQKKEEIDKHVTELIDNIDLFDPKTKTQSLSSEDQAGSATMISEPPNIKKFKSTNVFLRMTKSLDDDNTYRIKQSAAFLFTKVIFRSSLLLLSVIALIANPSFVVDHFWNLDGCTTYIYFLQYAAALIASEYAWECSMLAPYANVDKAIYLHHWFTILAAANILFGLYSPLATNYGILHIALNVTSPLCGSFRFQYADKLPDITRRICKFASIWMIVMIIVSWFTTGIIIYRAIVLGFDNHHVPLWSIVMYLITMLGWGYDDYHVVQTYWQWGHEQYEDADFDMNKLE